VFVLLMAGAGFVVYRLTEWAWGLMHWPRGGMPLVCVGGLLLFFIAITLSGRGVWRATAPIGDLMDAAGKIETGDYSTRVRERGPREVRAFVRAFNAMSEKLQANDEQRRRLLADVTHELRTPLTVVQGNLEALLDGVYPADAAHLTPILDETRVLSRLIDDLRTLSLAESGALQLHREPTDIGILLEEAASAFRTSAERAGVTLRVTVADELPLLTVDPVRLREVLTNLIANALRHTPRGGDIHLRGEQTGPTVTLTVSDTGSGIPPEMLPHIFDRFYKSDQSNGSGLGLAIARSLVAAHGGEIAAESEGVAGKGTVVRVRLPCSPPI
jgi:signal transduction histidine kinase